jgi:hypothetical protein
MGLVSPSVRILMGLLIRLADCINSLPSYDLPLRRNKVPFIFRKLFGDSNELTLPQEEKSIAVANANTKIRSVNMFCIG